MSKDKFEEYNQVEGALQEAFGSTQPSNEFLDDLETRLVKMHTQVYPENTRVQRQRFSFRWAFVPAVVLFVLSLFVVVVGPQNVLAEVQALLGYVPGVGFVDVNDTRVLLEPVSQTKDGITVTVKQVMVGPEETYLVLGVDGLEPPEILLEDYLYTPDQDIVEWQARSLALWESDGRLVLPDGSEVFGYNFQGAPWDGFYVMPSLPAEVLHATFTVTRLPGVPAEKAPQGWSFELDLGYVSEPVATPDAGGTGIDLSIPLPAGSPVGASSDTFGGYSLQVVEAVYAETETSIRLEIDGLPIVSSYTIIDLTGTLVDDLGNEYAFFISPVHGLQSDGTYVLSYDPILPEASSLTLTVNQLGLLLAVEGQTVMVDFGETPQIGDTLPMDSTVSIFGSPVHFSAVTLRTGEVVFIPEAETLNSFDFTIDPVTVENNIAVTGLTFSGETFTRLGSNFGTSAGGGGGGEQMAQNGEMIEFQTSIGIPASLPLPTGSYELPLSDASIRIFGPFVISWTIDK